MFLSVCDAASPQQKVQAMVLCMSQAGDLKAACFAFHSIRHFRFSVFDESREV